VPGALFGQLDGVVDSEAYGWAFDADFPDRPVKIAVYVNGKLVAESLAVYYRPDVAERLGCSGRHGFYLDLTHFCRRPSSTIVDVRLPNGNPVAGSPIRAHLPGSCVSSPSTLLFMHIPKTGGTALREAVLSNYKQSETAYLYPEVPGFPIQDLRELPLEQRGRLRLVVGHFQYGVHAHIPGNSSYFTVAREPLSRIWSHYNFLVRQGEIRSLEELIETKATANLDNMMVRCIAGVDERDVPPGAISGEIFELAVHNLENSFFHVGLQEHMDDAYRCLKEKYGWPGTVLPVLNRGTYGSRQCSESEEILVRQFNEWDFKLFERIAQSSNQRRRMAVA